MHYKSLVIRSLYLKLCSVRSCCSITVRIRVTDSVLISLYHSEHSLRIWCCNLRVNHSLPAVYKVISCKIRTVRPLKSVSQMECPCKSVIAYFILFSHARCYLTVLVNSEQVVGYHCDIVCTVSRLIQCRVNCLYIRSLFNSKNLSVLTCRLGTAAS